MVCIIDCSVNIFLPESALTSSYTSLTAAPHGSSSGSIPPPGTIHWSGCRLLLTNITLQRKRPWSGLWYWVQGARNIPPACLTSESLTIISVWRLNMVLFIQEAVNQKPGRGLAFWTLRTHTVIQFTQFTLTVKIKAGKKQVKQPTPECWHF